MIFLIIHLYNSNKDKILLSLNFEINSCIAIFFWNTSVIRFESHYNVCYTRKFVLFLPLLLSSFFLPPPFSTPFLLQVKYTLLIYNLNEFLFSFILCHALSSLKRPNRFLYTDVFFRQQFAYLDLTSTTAQAATATTTGTWYKNHLSVFPFWPSPMCPILGCCCVVFPVVSLTTTNIFTLTSFNLICEYFFGYPYPNKYWYAPNDGDPLWHLRGAWSLCLSVCVLRH